MSSSEQRLCRLAEQVAASEDPLRALELLVELRAELDAATRAQVARGLRAGRSFGELARVLGISRQAAHRRVRDLAPRQRRLAAADQARFLLRVAGEEAVRAKAATLASEHVLIAVLRGGGPAAELLRREGLTLEAARQRADGIAADDESAAKPAASPRALVREAAQAARARGKRWLDVDAMLLAALADPQGGACQTLTALSIDPAMIRDKLDPAPDVPPPPARHATGHAKAA